MTIELTSDPGLADELRALRRDEAYEERPVVLDATATWAGARAALAEIARLPGPVVLAAGGALDAAGLALCCACTVAFVDPESEPGEIEAAAALSLGLAGRITERIGPGAACRLLLGGDSSAFHALAIPAPAPLEAARALARSLGDPVTAVLARSLTFAARSTPAQSAGYDTELLELLPDREI